MKQPPPAANSPWLVRSASPDRAVALLLALLLFAIYLFFFSGRISSSDGLSMFAVTDSFVKRADVTTSQMWTFFGTKSAASPDGEVYSKYGYGTSLLAAPFYALALYTPFGGMMQVSLLSSAVAGALTAAFVFLASRELSFSASVSVLVALLFGLATPAFVYAKEFWSEPFAALTLFAAFYFSLRYRSSQSTRQALGAGIFLGVAIAVRTTNALLIPLYLWYMFLPRESRRPRPLLTFLAPVLISLISIFLYNYIRFQNPFTTGYRPDEVFSNNVLLGVYGLLFSPGLGLFVYAPILAALPFGIWQFYKLQRRELVFILLLSTCYLLLFSAWYYWWGGTNWAARFLVPMLPFLVLLCAPLVRLLLEPPGNPSRFTLDVLRFIFGALILLSLANELAGVSLNSLTYRLRMLTLSSNSDWDSIFLPAFSPLIGHWQTLKPTNFDAAWMRATPESIQIDWLVVGLTLALIIFCGWMLVRALRGQPIRRFALLGSALAALALTYVSLARYADDPRLGGSEGYSALLQTLAQEAGEREVLILNDDTHARFFLNSNRTPLKWYGLSRDPARWDESTRAFFANTVTQYPRVWFAYEDAVDEQNPMRDWFAAHLNAIRRFEFPNGLHLLLYESR